MPRHLEHGYGCYPNKGNGGSWNARERYGGFVEALLVTMGVILVLLTFGLAFTIYGEISFVTGVACFVAAALVFVHRVNALGKARPGQQRSEPS